MKNKNTLGLILLAGLLVGLFAACSPSFRKAHKAYQQQEIQKARSGFEYFLQHPKYAAAAHFFLGKIDLTETRDLPGLLAIDQSLAQADSLFAQLPARKARRQTRRYQLDSTTIRDLRLQTQRWAIVGTRVRRTLPALDSLLEGLPDPLPELQPEVDDTRRDIVNAHLETSDYDTMTAILRRHVEYVLPDNYDQTRRMHDALWPAFIQKYTPCEIDRFARDHPNSFAGRDCWLAKIQPLLCTGSLAQLLGFHAENRWTAIEIVLLNHIADKAETADTTALNENQRQHLRDLQRRNLLRRQLQNQPGQLDTLAVKEQALEYIVRFAPRYSAFRLMEECLQFFLNGENYSSAIDLLERARPAFPDTLPAHCQSNFDFQRRVKPWIDGKLPILRGMPKNMSRQKLDILNSPEGNEFSPVVSANGLEIFFAATGRRDNRAGADVFTTRRDSLNGRWSAPVLVPELSGFGQQVPLSITADSRQLLLLWNRRLYLSRRSGPAAPWSTPEPLPVEGIAVMGKGQLSADGNTLVLEGAYSAGSAAQAPDLDIFVSLRDPATGAWSRPAALGADINTDGEEASPFLSPDGRTLYYTSTGYPGLGSSDIFVTRRTKDDWTHWSRPVNLGKEINDTLPHRGFTSISPDGRRAWLSVDGDLWELVLPPE
ncbi:MAG: PD40 domain-containing protein [Lewinellaceae bacterium]|nr:PD40 domain-containing protein [Lewinellaceae bacterium]